jgi:hypothetical protein
MKGANDMNLLKAIVREAISPRANRDRFLGIDFVQYFRDFCAQHGPEEPVQQGRRLLFSDGWSFNAYSHRGPEWPPPSDPVKLRTIKITYWRARMQFVRKLLAFHAGRLRRLEGLSAAKETAGETRERLAWLLGEMDRAEAELTTLDAI